VPNVDLARLPIPNIGTTAMKSKQAKKTYIDVVNKAHAWVPSPNKYAT